MRRKNFWIKEVDDKGVVTATIATLNVKDKDGDVTRPGAFGRQDVTVVPAHDWMHVPLGKGILEESGELAVATMKMNLDIPAGRDWHSALKFDFEHGEPLQEWSYGFDITKRSEGEFDGETVQFLEGLKVHEVSPVLVGAGIGTGTLDVKKDKRISVQLEELERNLNSIGIVLADALKRAEQISAMRAKEGRQMSQATRAHFENMRLKILQWESEIETLLRQDEVMKDIGARLFAKYQKTQDELRRLGI